MNFVKELQKYYKARFPLILIQSTEEDRLTMDLQQLAKSSGLDLITWSIASGLKSDNQQFSEETKELKAALDNCEAIAKTGRRALFVFYDLVQIISSPQYIHYQRRLKEFALNIRTNGYNCCCILVSPESEISGSINSEITVLDYPRPNIKEIEEQISQFVNTYKKNQGVYIDTSPKTISALAYAAKGLTHVEIENCMSKALVEDGRLGMEDVKNILDEKKHIIRKSGILEYIENSLSLEDVGGLNVLKKWLTLRGATFSEAAQSFGLTPPKGVLLVGIPGCGKSLTAKCIAAAWNMPLLKLDMGKIFGRYVGDSEANIRQSLLTAEAIAPCVLWIDEIEKGLAGAGDKDSGTTSRVFGSILTWMQDKTSPVFTFATANNINNLPSELLRKGRFDEIFFVDLPDFEERKKILEIHIKKTKRNLKDFDLDRLATISGEETLGEGIRLSGAEIESWVKDALVEAYARRLNGNSQADLSMRDFETVIKRMVPMAKMRLEDFKRLREWANENAVSASVSASGSTTSTDNSSNLFGGRRLDLV
jgi:SpoVK/Ycf46/Vps4 family AAA+-type ATPase